MRIRKRSFFAIATTFATQTKDDLTDATIDQTTTKRNAVSTEGDRDGSHRRAAIIATTKIGEQSALGASRRHSTRGSVIPATNVGKPQ